MESPRFIFEIIPAEPRHALAQSLLQEMDDVPSGRIVLFFSLTFSLILHLMLFGWRFHP